MLPLHYTRKLKILLPICSMYLATPPVSTPSVGSLAKKSNKPVKLSQISSAPRPMKLSSSEAVVKPTILSLIVSPALRRFVASNATCAMKSSQPLSNTLAFWKLPNVYENAVRLFIICQWILPEKLNSMYLRNYCQKKPHWFRLCTPIMKSVLFKI
ncbi:MAG: hypothetical protein BWX60_00698 [Candidatus Marinimicrobia bacterium ADurb.Bin030]|nr:MAG: hypothetical protein BWX60_00698 [Candidatus Marinimicrobia bacterium ADurb.Bin030]